MPQGGNSDTCVKFSSLVYVVYLCVANFSSLLRIRCHISICGAAKVSKRLTTEDLTACAKFQLCESCVFIDDGPTRKFYLAMLFYLYGRRVRNWLLPLEPPMAHRGTLALLEKSTAGSLIVI